MFARPALLVMLITFPLLAEPSVRSIRTPDGGIQPQAVVDAQNTIHLIFFKGEAAHGDLYYTRSTDSGTTFSKPIRVNSQDGSAIATGTIRGAHVALGRNDRVSVAWNGSSLAEPKGPGNAGPMLYARLNDAGAPFEPQRNIIAQHYGLDGGGSVAADRDGNVYVAWHAPETRGAGEADRRVWVAKSADDGKSFAPEKQASAGATGACACCGMRLFADGGGVYALYRSASEMVNRDIYLLRSDDHGGTFQSARIAPMKIGQCVMSSAAMIEAKDGVIAAWETQSQIYWARLASRGAKISDPTAAPGEANARKHPALAANSRGEVLLAWTEGTGWNKGGSVAWQVYNAAGQPIPSLRGKAPGVPTWSLPAAFATADGDFVVVY